MNHSKLAPFLLLTATLFLASCSDTGSNTVTSTTSTEASTSSSDTTSTPTSTTSKTVNYRTDHGKHMVTATFDIQKKSDGTITGVSATMDQGDHESAEYIARFNNAAKSKLVGKKISELSLNSVWGASDTTSAFLNAISSL